MPAATTRSCRRCAQAGKQARAIGQGLASIEPESGVLVAYAARDGTMALDGESENSPYAEALVKHLAEPGLEISLLFRKVRDEVLGEDSAPAGALHLRLPAGAAVLFQAVMSVSGLGSARIAPRSPMAARLGL